MRLKKMKYFIMDLHCLHLFKWEAIAQSIIDSKNTNVGFTAFQPE